MMAKVDLAAKLDDARAQVEAERPPEDRGLARFARLTRKDARVRTDQDAALSALTKALMRRRTVKTERITDNTLIRVAIDLLLAHANELRGSTEDELRRSVTSGLPNSRTSEVSHFPPSGVPFSPYPEVRHSAGAGDADSAGSGLPDFHRPGATDSRADEVAASDSSSASASDRTGFPDDRTAEHPLSRASAPFTPNTRHAQPPAGGDAGARHPLSDPVIATPAPSDSRALGRRG